MKMLYHELSILKYLDVKNSVKKLTFSHCPIPQFKWPKKLESPKLGNLKGICVSDGFLEYGLPFIFKQDLSPISWRMEQVP